jgi:hypothetical protein
MNAPQAEPSELPRQYKMITSGAQAVLIFVTCLGSDTFLQYLWIERWMSQLYVFVTISFCMSVLCRQWKCSSRIKYSILEQSYFVDFYWKCQLDDLTSYNAFLDGSPDRGQNAIYREVTAKFPANKLVSESCDLIFRESCCSYNRDIDTADK